MMTTVTILAVVFGLMGLGLSIKFVFGGGLNVLETIVWLFSVVVASIAIGVHTAGSWGAFIA